MEERFTRGRFIRLAAALGVGAAGASILAACGGGEKAEGGGEEKKAPGDAKGELTQVESGTPIYQESEVPPGSAEPFTDEENGQPALLVHLDNGDFVAYSAVCTHQACIVGYQPETQKLACPCHGSVFDPSRGAAVETGPATSPLPEVEIEVREDEVFLA